MTLKKIDLILILQLIIIGGICMLILTGCAKKEEKFTVWKPTDKEIVESFHRVVAGLK